MTLVDRIRTDRTIRHVGDFAHAQGMTVRSLQRLFAAYVGVGPKWIILRYRIHEALEHAEASHPVDWAALAADLGYADQAHLVRDFTATVGVPPTAYARGVAERGRFAFSPLPLPELSALRAQHQPPPHPALRQPRMRLRRVLQRIRLRHPSRQHPLIHQRHQLREPSPIGGSPRRQRSAPLARTPAPYAG